MSPKHRSGAWRLAGSLSILCAASLAGATGPSVPARTHIVRIEGMRFVPSTLVVQAGDRVTWRNDDLVPHTATAASVFDSTTIAPGGTWSHVVARRGAIAYVCTLHPGMQGMLDVR